MKEIFKDILGYEGLYQVSNLGNVKSMYTNKILSAATKKEDTSMLIFIRTNYLRCIKSIDW